MPEDIDLEFTPITTPITTSARAALETAIRSLSSLPDPIVIEWHFVRERHRRLDLTDVCRAALAAMPGWTLVRVEEVTQHFEVHFDVDQEAEIVRLRAALTAVRPYVVSSTAPNSVLADLDAALTLSEPHA